MRTIIAVFLLSLLLSLIITPFLEWIARRYGLMDQPSTRKVHKRATPRIGGIAIYWAFFLPFLTFLFHSTAVTELLQFNREIVSLVLGASLVFGLGLLDDVKSLSARVKFPVQIAAALIACWGGLTISSVFLPWGLEFDLGPFSVFATIFWFLLVINAVNLIDGLDGLAAGVAFFSSIVLLILSIMSHKFLLAMGLAAIGGACLGFLRYNFNPASIFMGDSGSYFLGYMLAGLSVMGSVKSQTAVAILIPVIALGLPLMDTLWAPIRRFIFGRGLFQPDKDHLHHRLLRHGLSERRAVVIMYTLTVCLGIMAIALVNARDSQAALILIVIGAALILGIRQLGYLDFLTPTSVMHWVKDIGDELGVANDRRKFLSWQANIMQATTVEELWNSIVETAAFLGLDHVEFKLEPVADATTSAGEVIYRWGAKAEDNEGGIEAILPSNCSLRLRVPLEDADHMLMGSILFAKDTACSAMPPHILRRIEQLRRSVNGVLLRLRREEALFEEQRLQQHVTVITSKPL